MSGKVFIRTHGCQMNEYDSDKMQDVLLKSHNLSITDVEEEADVILINTCSIREKAQEKVFSQLGRWRKIKEKNPDVIIGVGGCVASQEGEAIIKRAPYVDLVFGPQTIHRLPALLDERNKQQKPQVDISFPEIEKFDNLPEPRKDGPAKKPDWTIVPSLRIMTYREGVDDFEYARILEDLIKECANHKLTFQTMNHFYRLLAQTIEFILGDVPFVMKIV